MTHQTHDFPMPIEPDGEPLLKVQDPGGPLVSGWTCPRCGVRGERPDVCPNDDPDCPLVPL